MSQRQHPEESGPIQLRYTSCHTIAGNVGVVTLLFSVHGLIVGAEYLADICVMRNGRYQEVWAAKIAVNPGETTLDISAGIQPFSVSDVSSDTDRSGDIDRSRDQDADRSQSADKSQEQNIDRSRDQDADRSQDIDRSQDQDVIDRDEDVDRDRDTDLTDTSQDVSVQVRILDTFYLLPPHEVLLATQSMQLHLRTCQERLT
mmetsp:Transcript_65354/g.95725  ORF Transcript_65354/g.95725 Transcript_65354/m.95725 type:complete len:202 (-) Transcript_65354:42-647(-)